jgi:hypothetical protein
MQALFNVFDTNHNGKLDAGDEKFSQFELVVANPDRTQRSRQWRKRASPPDVAGASSTAQGCF